MLQRQMKDFSCPAKHQGLAGWELWITGGFKLERLLTLTPYMAFSPKREEFGSSPSCKTGRFLGKESENPGAWASGWAWVSPGIWGVQPPGLACFENSHMG